MTKAGSRENGAGSGAHGAVIATAVDRLHPAPWNARQSFDGAALAGLTQSIQRHGIQVPLTVRPSGPGIGFEIVCGHRRYAAARAAGLDVVPCLVRELSDEQAEEIALVDNLQRADVPAVEEAEAFGKLVERLGSIAAVAATVGKEQSYVARRVRLRALTTWSAEALREQLITIDHALLLCRLAEVEQNAALKWCLDAQAGAKKPVDEVIQERLAARKPGGYVDDEEVEIGEAAERPRWRWTWEPATVQKLKDHIETESGIPLDRAPWPMEEDWLLPDAGSCLDCEKNTKANAPLFGDLDTGVAVCTDGACFQAKVCGFVDHGLREAAKAEGALLPVLKVSWKATSKEPRMELGEPCDGPEGLNNFTRVPVLKQVFKAGQWIEAAKKCEHTRSAVTADWSDANQRGYVGGSEELRRPGEIIQVCVTPKCKAHPKAYEQTAAAAKEQKSEAERKAQAAKAAEEFNAFKAAETPVREALYTAVRAKIKPETIKRNLLLNALDWRARNAVCLAAGFEEVGYEQRESYFKQRVKDAPAANLDDLLFDAAFGSQLVIDGNAMRWKDRGRAGLRELAKIAGVNAGAIERGFEKAGKSAGKRASKSAKSPEKKAAKKAAAAKKGGAR